MKFNIYHLSDIHFKETETDNSILKKRTDLFDTIKNEVIDSDFNILVVTGDVAFSGLTKEYEHATIFFEYLIDSIKKYTNKECYFISIPGNHDCAFNPTKEKMRKRIIDSFESQGFDDLTEDEIDLCCYPQDNYFNWVNSLKFNASSDYKVLQNNKLLQIVELKLGDNNIIFNCFNTSWISKQNEIYGKMIFPTTHFSKNHFLTSSDLTFNLIHHPFNWQHQTHYRVFKKFLEETGDIILSGHEHHQGMHINLSEDGKFTGYIESGALQDSKNSNVSSFNLLKFDIPNESYKTLRYNTKADVYQKDSESNWTKYEHRFNLSKKKYILSSDFNEELYGSGAPFIHSIYGEINFLDEIYVYPDLRKSSNKISKPSVKFPAITNSKKILFTDCEDLKFIIVGDDISGKTALCRQLFSYYYTKNLVPIFLTGEDLDAFDISKFRKKLKEVFSKQYEKRNHAQFDLINNDDIVLIIDNFQKCPLKENSRFKLIKNLLAVYKNTIFTSNTAVVFQPFFIKNTNHDFFEEFDQFALLPFNVELRYELINKWNSLGRDDFESANEVVSLNEQADKHIKKLLTNNLIPAYPLNILSLLQSMEAGGVSDNLIINSYDLLIGNAINKSIPNKNEQEFYIEFLTFYCNHLFENKLKEISSDSFNAVFKQYLKMGNFEMYYTEVFNSLKKARMIKERDGYISISNKYIYFYFVARYFSQRISEPEVKKTVIEMSKRVYRDEFYNIILFLTHFTKENFIIENLYNNANNLFHLNNPIQLDDDISLINKLVDELPSLVVESMHSDDSLKQVIAQKTEFEEGEEAIFNSNANSTYNIEEDIDAIGFLNQFILAIKTFELLGRITQKNWSLPNSEDKIKYTEATFNLALRSLGFYFNAITSNKDGIVEYLKYVAGKEKITNLNEIKDLTGRFLFTCAYMASFGLIKRCSNAIGHSKLYNTYDELIAKNNFLSYKLITLSIKLDHSDQIPFKLIEEISSTKGFNKNFLPKHLVQNFVFNHLRIYKTTVSEKQKVCEIVGIEIKEQLVAEISSKEKI